MKDGSERSIEVDVVQYCTGYGYNFAFLDPADNIVSVDYDEGRGKYITPLYKQIFSARHPEYMIANVQTTNIFTQMHIHKQAKVMKYYVGGRLKLPSSEDMLSAVAADEKEWKDKPELIYRRFHFCNEGFDPMSYADELYALVKAGGVDVP